MLDVDILDVVNCDQCAVPVNLYPIEDFSTANAESRPTPLLKFQTSYTDSHRCNLKQRCSASDS